METVAECFPLVAYVSPVLPVCPGHPEASGRGSPNQTLLFWGERHNGRGGRARTGTLPQAKQKLRRECRDGGWNSKQTGNSHGHGCSQSPKNAVHREIVGSPQNVVPELLYFRAAAAGVGRVIEQIDPILRGWVQYFAVGHSSRCFSFLRYRVETKIRRNCRSHSMINSPRELATHERIFAVIGMDLYPTGIRPKVRNRTSDIPEPVF